MEGIQLVPINIWDDYLSDENVSEGLSQKTYAYVESDKIPLEDQMKYLAYLMDYIMQRAHLVSVGMTLKLVLYDSKEVYPNLPDNMHFKRWEIKFEGLTHEMRERYVKELNNGDMPFDIYSES